MSSDELRAKIIDEITQVSFYNSVENERIADRILALLTPPAWHDAASVQPRQWERVTIYTSIGSVVQGYFDGTNWRQEGKDNELIGVTHWRELPRPPGATPSATAKLPEGVKIHHAKRTTDSSYFWVGNSTGDMYFSETLGWKPLLDNGSPGSLWTQQEDAVKSALSAPPVPRESKPTLGTSTRCSTCGFDGMNHMSTAARDAETIRSQAARIAELEAENARIRAQYDMVEQERTRLMLGQQVPYTPAEKPAPRNFVATGEQRQDDYYEKPITEMKPDPLARAVTVGEMLRLADLFEEKSFYKKAIRTVFPQGAAHAE